MNLTINTNFPPQELRRIVESIHPSNPPHNQQQRTPQQRKDEIDYLMSQLKDHTINPPTPQDLQPIYDTGGRIHLRSKVGSTIDYQA